MIFRLIVIYLGFLKHVPLLPHVFDVLLKMFYLVFRPDVIHCMDEIEETVSRWDGVYISMHKFGGIQFNYHQTEIGHIHGNGLLDIRFSRARKKQLLADKRAEEHHVFRDSGWISVHIRNEKDAGNAIALLSERLVSLKANDQLVLR